MPTYQYKCRKCGYEFEEFQGITDAPIDTCPKCEGITVRIITGGAGFVLKGSGFYSTDYRSQSYREAEKKENSEIVVSALSADYRTKRLEADIFLRLGRLLSNIVRFADRRSRFSVRTPTTVVGVRGTEFIVEMTDAQQTEVGVFEGDVFVGGIDNQGNLIKGSEVPVTQGNQTTILLHRRPRPPFALRGRMLLHKKRLIFHRKRALDRRRNLYRIRGRRLEIHKRVLERWKRIRRTGPPPRVRPGRPLPPHRRPGAPPPHRRRPFVKPPPRR